jgi:hypothetical protein
VIEEVRMGLTIETTAYGRWDKAYRLALGDVVMVVVTEVGPRILSLTVGGGPNLLFVDDDLSLSRGAGEGAWYIYGGHRVWISPESEASYAPDNTPCSVYFDGDRLDVLGPVDQATRLQRRLSVYAREGRFVVESAVRNAGDTLFLGAAWAITCVVPRGVVTFPWGTGGRWDQKTITYWNRWMDHGSDIGSNQWRPGADLFRVYPSGEEGKVGANSPEGWVAQCRRDATFVKSRSWAPADYPDGGCSLEVYTCDQFIELEMLGPNQYIYPASEAVVVEEWTITSDSVDPKDGDALRRRVGLV